MGLCPRRIRAANDPPCHERNEELGWFRACSRDWIWNAGSSISSESLGEVLRRLFMQYVVTTFPILAPLPVSDNGSALGLYIFIRSFFSVCFLFCPSCVSEDTDTLCIGLGIDYRLNGSRESTQDKNSRRRSCNRYQRDWRYLTPPFLKYQRSQNL